MTGFSAKDAALEGFRLTREHPAAIAVWSVLWFGFSLLLFATLAKADLITVITNLQTKGQPSPDEAVALMGRMLGAFSLVFPTWLALFVLTQTAVLRMVLRPSETGLAFLRISVDEARILLVQLAIGLMMFGAYLACMIIAVIGGVQPALVSLSILATFVACGVIAIRFSLAAPQTFATGRLALAESLRLTKGRFLPLLGAYAMVILMNLLVSVLGSIIANAVAGVAGIKGDAKTLEEVLSPGFLVILVLQGVFQALTLVLTLAAPARIYKDLVAGEAA